MKFALLLFYTLAHGQYNLNIGAEKIFTVDEIANGEYGSTAGKYDQFVYRNGSSLYLGADKFRFVSFNIPSLLMLEDRIKGEWVTPTRLEQQDAILTVKGMNGKVIRAYSLGYGKGQHFEGNELGEEAFVAMDHALDLCRIHNIRLIIPIINMHHGGDDTGIGLYGDFKHLTDLNNVKPSQFYTNNAVKTSLKSLLTKMLNRINTVNGVKYANDPYILGWQLGNELGGWDEQIPPSEWSLDIAQHLKSHAPKTLVFDGSFGGLNFQSRIPPAILKSNLIDCHFNHYYYGDSDYKRIDQDSELVTGKYEKPFVITEFGFSKSFIQGVVQKVMKSERITGALAWSLRYRARDGGFYYHSEGKNGYLSFHAPGTTKMDGFSHQDEISIISTIKTAALTVSTNATYNFKVPIPSKAEGKITPSTLRWFGSAWADGYNVYRYTLGSNKTRYDYLANVKDLKPFGKVLYDDKTIEKGKTYLYKIRAMPHKGFESIPGELKLGPFRP